VVKHSSKLLPGDESSVQAQLQGAWHASCLPAGLVCAEALRWR
jgi:hypothetical protein